MRWATMSPSSGESSWMKWPAFSRVVWGCPRVPGIVWRISSSANTLGGGVVGGDGDEQREDDGAGLVALVGMGSVVAGLHVRRQLGGAVDVDDVPHVEGVQLLAELAPPHERVTQEAVTGGQVGVHRHDPTEPLRVLRHKPQSDEATPVVADQRDVPQIEPVEQRRAGPCDVAVVGVVLASYRLVRAAETDQVRCHAAMTRADERRDHVPIGIAPSRFAMEQHNGRPRLSRPTGSFVDVVHAHSCPGLGASSNPHEVRKEGVVVQVREPVERRTKHIQALATAGTTGAQRAGGRLS